MSDQGIKEYVSHVAYPLLVAIITLAILFPLASEVLHFTSMRTMCMGNAPDATSGSKEINMNMGYAWAIAGSTSYFN